MDRLSLFDALLFLASMGILYGCARLMGSLARRVQQPSMLGFVLAGIILGPTVFGSLAPRTADALFPWAGPVALAFGMLITLSAVMFLLVAAMDIDLSVIHGQGRPSYLFGAISFIVPFGIGSLLATLYPQYAGFETGNDPLLFTLFFATALTISALPVVSRSLSDLNLFRSERGMLLNAAAMFADVAGWMCFAVVLGVARRVTHTPADFLIVIGIVLVLFAVTASAGRAVLIRVFDRMREMRRLPALLPLIAVILAVLFALGTERLGLHAIVGAYLAGLALGSTVPPRKDAHPALARLVNSIFAPLLFASAGLRVNFLDHFDPGLVALVFGVSIAGKLLGCGIGAWLNRVPPREAWAAQFGLNTRGMMEVVLGSLALQFGIIGVPLFVALVLTAFGTSVLGGPIMQYLLRHRAKRRFSDYLSEHGYIPALRSATREKAIAELVEVLPLPAAVARHEVLEAVLTRERRMATGVGECVAVPHARVSALPAPVLGLGFSRTGIDFNAPDGKPANIVCLLLTPEYDESAQLELLGDISRTFMRPALRARALGARNYDDLLALLGGRR